MTEHGAESLQGKRCLRAKLVRVYALQVMLISVAALVGLFMTYVIVQNVLTREALTTETDYFWAERAKDPNHLSGFSVNLEKSILEA